MKLDELTTSEVAALARAEGIPLQVGPFVVRMQTPWSDVSAAVRFLYGDFVLDEGVGFADFYLRVSGPPGIRRLVRPQARFESDRRVPFMAQPRSAALALLEWGFNWCVYSQAHQYLVIHAATVERDGDALLLPAPANSGKSTLCAALVSSGWRLLSDEFALTRSSDGEVIPLPRPIGLKNQSIKVISSLFPAARLGPLVTNTAKGRVAHLKPPLDSVRRADEPATPAWVVIPRFEPNAPARLTPLSKGRALIALAGNALNYGVLGRSGFETLAALVDAASCFELTFSDLKETTDLVATLQGLRGIRRPLPPAARLAQTSEMTPSRGTGRTRRQLPGRRGNIVLAVFNRPEVVRSLDLAEWDLLVRQARRAGVLARLRARLDMLGLAAAIPLRVRWHLDAVTSMAAHDARVARWEIDRIRRALAATNVPVTLLKGAAYLMAELPVARGRRFSDVDILVPHASLEEVETALREHGWQAAMTDEYYQHYYRRWAHELPPLWHRDRRTVVDVHHTILPITGRLRPDASRLLAGTRTIEGSALRVLSPAHMILHSAAHLFQDEVYGAFGNLLDLDGLLRHFAAPHFWQELVDEARALDLERPLFYALRYATALLETPVPSAVALAVTAACNNVTLPLMDRLVMLALTPDHPDHRSATAETARWLLYVRAHWLRMPPGLLARHLSRKAILRTRPKAASPVGINTLR